MSKSIQHVIVLTSATPPPPKKRLNRILGKDLRTVPCKKFCLILFLLYPPEKKPKTKISFLRGVNIKINIQSVWFPNFSVNVSQSLYHYGTLEIVFMSHKNYHIPFFITISFNYLFILGNPKWPNGSKEHSLRNNVVSIK